MLFVELTNSSWKRAGCVAKAAEVEASQPRWDHEEVIQEHEEVNEDYKITQEVKPHDATVYSPFTAVAD